MVRVREAKRDNLISWDIVCKLEVQMSLVFRKISLRSRALLEK